MEVNFQIWFRLNTHKQRSRSLKNFQDNYQELQDSNQEIQETLESCRFSQDSHTPTGLTKNQI